MFVLVPVLAHADTHNTAEPTNDVLLVRHIVVPEDRVYTHRFEYFIDLLQLALTKSGQPFLLEAVPIPPVPTTRNIRYLKEGRFHVTWMHTDTAREEQVRPIRVPIFRGLIGWRLLMIHQDNAELFSSINSINTLKALKAGQGHDWPDTAILKNHHFNVRTSYNWKGIYNLLQNKRIDYFPRGIIEIWDEIERLEKHLIETNPNDNLNTIIDNNIALNYPSAFYFFVANENELLAQALERGFLEAYKDGSFQQLFMAYFGEDIRRSKLINRTIYTLTNDALPKDTPLHDKTLWFSPDEMFTAPE